MADGNIERLQNGGGQRVRPSVRAEVRRAREAFPSQVVWAERSAGGKKFEVQVVHPDHFHGAPEDAIW